MYSYGPPHMAEQKQDDQLEHTFSNFLRIRDVVQKTCQRRWTIGKSGERGSGISVLPARHDYDEDDDEDMYIYIYIYIYIYSGHSKISKLPQILDLLHISHLCMGLTHIEIKTEVWICLSSFIRISSVAATKMLYYKSSF